MPFEMTDHGWTEGTLTWKNASLAHDGYWGDFLSWPGNTWRELDLAGAVTGDGVYTFALASPLPVGMMDFWSRETGSYVPVLAVTFVPAP